MKRVLILYGWHGSDAPHWQDWLAKSLLKRGYQVSFPQLSDNLRPEKSLWLQEAKKAFDVIRPDIVIAHSMGNTLWFHLCNEGMVTPVSNLVLVAPPRDLSEINDIKSFFPCKRPSDLFAKESIMICSDDDPYISVDESKELSKQLGCRLKLIEKAGHINSDSGFGPWPWMLEYILSLGENQ